MAECDLFDVLKSEEIIAKVTKLLQEGCGSSRGSKGGQCCEQFSKEVVLSKLNNCLELSHGELDLVILANIQACTNSEIIGEKRKESSQSSFLYLNRPICRDMFLNLYRISYSRFRRLRTRTLTKGSWKLQETTAQHLAPSRNRGRKELSK